MTNTLSEHLNQMDHTGNIKLTHEEETNTPISFLDMKSTQKEYNILKIKIYRKPTHTDQYLLWTSERPTTHSQSSECDMTRPQSLQIHRTERRKKNILKNVMVTLPHITFIP